MTDRFKFRVWCKTYKEWEQDIVRISLNGDMCVKSKKDLEWLNPYILSDKNHILMQCTGLKDCEDKLIYEGDIAKDSDGYEHYEVIWDNDTASFRLKQGDWLNEFDNDIEIIGNIHENPELLEVLK